jgi:uncharacterized protein (TIGR02001 family)
VRHASLSPIVLALVWVGAAHAQMAPDAAPPLKPTFSVSLGAASDYVFRGVSRTADRPQAFGGLSVGVADGYAGVWASNAAFPAPEHGVNGAEVDIYGGWRPEVMGYSLDLGAQYEGFAGAPAGPRLDYAEVYAKAARTIGPLTGRLGVHFAPSVAHRPAWYVEVGADYVPARDWTISAGVGRQTGEATAVGGGDYLTWNAGVSRSLFGHVSLGVRYSDTDGHRYGQAYGTRVVGELRADF